MSNYSGRHAALYDVMYASKPYREEAAFVDRCFKTYGDRTVTSVLEMACGTGGHALCLEKLGYQISAFDLSEDMISTAKDKAKARQAKIDFKVFDMCAVENFPGSYDAAICLFDAIGFSRSNEKIQQILRGVHRKLSDRGLFIFEFWHASAMLKHHEPTRVKRIEIGDGEILRISQTKLDVANSLAHVDHLIYEFKNNGSFQKSSEVYTNRFFQVPEMDLALRSHGFFPVRYFSGFTEDQNIDEQTWHVLVVARKQP